MRHLAIFIGDAIDKILRGEKTVEVRFSISKISPYEYVMKDDEIYLKQSGGLVIGKAKVDNVLYYENLDGETIGKIRREYANELCVDDGFWKLRSKSKYVTLIFLKNPERFLAPLRFSKHDRRPWVVLKDDKILKK